MTEAKRRLKNFDFSDPDAHVALVDAAANGLKVLVKKRFEDIRRFDSDADEMVPLEESGLKVNMSLEDMLMFFTDLFPEDIETLTGAITKAKDGKELGDLLEAHVKKSPGALPFDVFAARREAFQDKLEKLDTGAMDALRQASVVISEFLDRGIKPGDSDASPIPNLVEKSKMTKDKDGNDIAVVDDLDKSATGADTGADATPAASASEVPESVQKSLDEQATTIQKQADVIKKLEKAEDERVAATFITKAETFKALGLPEVEDGKEAVSEFGQALKSLSEADPDAYAQVESVLMKALDTISKGENLKEIGGDGQPDVSDSATALDKAATELQKEDPSLSKEAAITKALEIDPKLYG